jgi:hypothetical protein
LRLYAGGAELDCFANGRFPFYEFGTANEAKQVAGTPEKWMSALGLSTAKELGAAFDQQADVDTILERVAGGLGWNLDLAQCGYYVAYDGVPHHYTDHLENSHAYDMLEMHFEMA